MVINGNDDPKKDYFHKYYMPLVEIKYFNALIVNKLFCEQPVKSKQEAYKKLIKISRNNDDRIGNLLDYLYHQKYYNLIGIDLPRETNTNILQQINFTVLKLEEDDSATIFFIAEKQQKIILI